VKKIIRTFLLIIILTLTFYNSIFSYAETAKTVYLTFDDGPSENTVKILDILKKYNVKATFFIVRREGYEKVLRRIVNEGHTLGGHSASHRYKVIYKSAESFYNDLNALNDYVLKNTGTRFSVIRFPGGSNNTVSERFGGKGIMKEITLKAEKYGYTYYDWNVDSFDSLSPLISHEEIADNAVTQCMARKNAIVLLHDSPNKINTPESLHQIIETLRKEGYNFKRITEETPQVIFKN